MTEKMLKSLHRSHWLDYPLIHLSTLLLLGVMLPPIVWFAPDWDRLIQPHAINTALAGCVAVAITWYSLERLRYFAKARRLSYVFPINLATFAMCFGVIALLRLPYSNVVAVLNFFSVSILSYVIAGLTRKSGVVQWIIPGGNSSVVASLPNVLGELDLTSIEALIHSEDPKAAIIADLNHNHDAQWEAFIAEAAINGIPVYHYRQIIEMQTGQVRIDHLRENVFGSLIPNLAYTEFKRAIDIVSALLLIPVLAPLFLIVAIAIRLETPGPILFHQERMGFKGRPFRMHKFRSMRPQPTIKDRSGAINDMITQTGDSRITRVGSIIRRFRIDELPQLVNILKGEMSWIGPRPEARSLSDLYQTEIPYYRYRHIVRPGITGWAQVNQGHVAAIDEVRAKLSYDFYYIRNISLWLDVLIVLKTIRTVVGGVGAK